MKKSPMEENTRTEVANAEKLVGMAKDIEYIKIAMDDIKKLINEFKDGYANKEEFQQLEERVSKIENNVIWVVRVVLGTIITAVLALLIAKV